MSVRDHRDSGRVRAAASQCLGKARHGNRADARTEARKAKGRCGDLMESYRCPHCGGWHIGHAIGAALKRRFKK